MTERFRIALAQANPVVGGLKANAEKALRFHEKAHKRGADLLAFPEMFISGYPAQDLVLKKAFTNDCAEWLRWLAERVSGGPMVGIGGPHMEGGNLYNAYFVLRGGEVVARTLKHHLPNHAVFDEARHFVQGPHHGPLRLGPVRVGIAICEDAWHEDVCETLSESGAEILLVPNGSPYRRLKLDTRARIMVSRVVETGLPLVYLNMVGGQDDQIFDGGSFVLNPRGELAMQMPLFSECLEITEFRKTDDGWRAERDRLASIPDEWEQDYRAMVETLRDYLRKSGFSSVLLGLSGGVDSALVATIGADAVGPKNVRCVVLPSEFTSTESREDAVRVAENLGCGSHLVDISSLMAEAGNTLEPVLGGHPDGLTAENLQPRLRGLLLMAISNKYGDLLLTTGNKSEAAVGYATIYGDMAGGYNPIKDMYKSRVFETCRWRNQNHFDWMSGPKGAVIPERVISKPPTAELRSGQKDSDSLPPYDVLDPILEMLIDEDLSVGEVVEKGFDREMVRRVESLIYASEYKRFQSAPGTRLTGRALWLDRRYPIVNHWRDPAGVERR